jgi:hypothetical protein
VLGGVAEDLVRVAVCVNVLAESDARDVGVLLSEVEGAEDGNEDAEVEVAALLVLDTDEEPEDAEELPDDDVDKEFELEVDDADEAEEESAITGVAVGVADDAVFAAFAVEEALRLVRVDGVRPGIKPPGPTTPWGARLRSKRLWFNSWGELASATKAKAKSNAR